MNRHHTPIPIGLLYAILTTFQSFGSVQGTSSDTNVPRKAQLISTSHFDTTGAASLKKAFKEHPSDVQAAFNYAAVAPCSLSVAIYTRVSADTNASDSLRAAAYRQLGDYSFVRSAFGTAMEKYRRAAEHYADPQYEHLQACAAAAMNDTATARALWKKITAKTDSDLAGQAQYRLALLDMKTGAFGAAFTELGLIGDIDPRRSWTVAAMAARLECALRLGKKDSVAVLEKKLQPFNANLLERKLLNGTSALRAPGGKTTPSAAVSGVTPDEKTEYTLQVGAFSSLENATTLKKKLLATYTDVSILPVTMTEKIFYRVRVGTFKDRDIAETFGTDSLMPSGIRYQVVVK